MRKGSIVVCVFVWPFLKSSEERWVEYRELKEEPERKRKNKTRKENMKGREGGMYRKKRISKGSNNVPREKTKKN